MNAPIQGFNPYPVDAFPPVARNAIQELQRNVQAPLSLISTAVLALLSATAQANVKVKLPTGGEPKAPTLYTAAVAEPGERKTTIYRLVFSPLYKRDEIYEARHRAELDAYVVKQSIHTSVMREITRKITQATCEGKPLEELTAMLKEQHKIKPVKPQSRRLIYQNASERSIMDALEGDGRSIALLGDEGEFILRSPLFSQNGLLNKAWDGGPVVMDRANGLSLAARDTRMTVSIMAQSEVLQEFAKKRGKSARGSGLLARFLVTWPTSTQGSRFNHADTQSWEALHALHGLADELMGDGTLATSNDQVVYEFDEDACREWFHYINFIESLMQPKGTLASIPDFASKAGEITARIAALLHHFGRCQGKMTRETLLCAMRIMDFYISEFLRLFSPPHEVPIVQTEAQALEHYLMRVCWMRGYKLIPSNDVYRNFKIRGDTGSFKSALQLLIHQGKITVQPINGKKLWIFLNEQYFGSLQRQAL